MNICYLLESTELCGGVRVVFDQANALQKRGHNVIIRSITGNDKWYPYDTNIQYVSTLEEPFQPDFKPDVIIGTYWTTIPAAIKLNAPLTFHLCQGYEGSFPEFQEQKDAIDSIYKTPIPKLSIGPWLTKCLVQEFGKNSFKIYEVGQIVDTDLFRPPSFFKRLYNVFQKQCNRILMVGSFHIKVKGIPCGLMAIKILREKGIPLKVIRVTTENSHTEENSITPIDEMYIKISPNKMKKIYNASHLLVAPSSPQEGFGLPFAEALACGLPVAATPIPSYLSFANKKNYALFAQEDNPISLAHTILQLILNRWLRFKFQLMGPKVVAKKFSSECVAQKLEKAFYEYKSLAI